MEYTPEGAQRPAADVPCKDGVAGPEAEAAHSECEAPARLWGATGNCNRRRAMRLLAFAGFRERRAAQFPVCGFGKFDSRREILGILGFVCRQGQRMQFAHEL